MVLLDVETVELTLKRVMRDRIVRLGVRSWGNGTRLEGEVFSGTASRLCERSTSLVVGNVTLARVREVGKNGGNATGGGSLAGRDGDQKLDEMVVDTATSRLDHENIFTTN